MGDQVTLQFLQQAMSFYEQLQLSTKSTVNQAQQLILFTHSS